MGAARRQGATELGGQLRFFRPKTLGLALGSGSARGLAHIGVLKRFETAGVQPQAITGTSMGAVIGALYAAGYPAAKIEEIALAFDLKNLLSLADLTLKKGSVISGGAIEKLLRAHLPETFEELKIPFGCASTDLYTGSGVQHSSGDLITAVRASLSIPVVFRPVEHEDRLLVDGFLTNPVPVNLARELGARTVVAVNVSGGGGIDRIKAAANGSAGSVKDFLAMVRGEEYKRSELSSIDVAMASVEIVEREIAREQIHLADVVIAPDVRSYRGYEFLSASQLIVLGEAAAEIGLPEVRRRARLN